ncbi:MAG: DUF4198 domain-containing protein [bacterium]|nr:DUF4198 domain-containing protein [bacterium]
MKTGSVFVRLSLVCGLLVLIAGCGNSSIGRVTGTVHLDGQPLEGAVITFYPVTAGAAAQGMRGGGASYGRTDAEGKYELVYNRDEKGAELGEHKVVITTLEEGGGGDYGAGSPEKLPKRYNVETELTATVTSGSNTIDFLDLTSEGEKQEARGERY